jgi:hypothetical protein
MERATRSHEDPMEDVCMHDGCPSGDDGCAHHAAALLKNRHRSATVAGRPDAASPPVAALKVVRSASSMLPIGRAVRNCYAFAAVGE